MLAGVIVGLEGEPLLYNNLPGFMELAETHSRAITIITNGGPLTEKVCRDWANFSIKNIILSVDAADRLSYERFRKNGGFERFKKNAAMVAGMLPCQFHATVFKENLKSLLGMPALAYDLGIKRLSLQLLRSHPGSMARHIRSASRAELSRWLPEMRANAAQYNIDLGFDRNFGDLVWESDQIDAASIKHTTGNGTHCEHADTLACVLSDGRLFPCAGDFEPVPIKEYSFDGMFNHPYLLALRALRGAGRLIEPCRICMNIEH